MKALLLPVNAEPLPSNSKAIYLSTEVEPDIFKCPVTFTLSFNVKSP